MSLLALEGVTRSFRRGSEVVPVVRGVTLEIAKSEVLGIVGPSGSGKSTLMNMIGLLDRPSSGRVLLAGHDTSRLDDDGMARLRGRAIGFVFQSYHLVPRMSALDNVALPLVYARVTRDERNRAAADALSAVGLAHRAHHRPNQLSGGEQQRVAIARALVRRPPLVLADEPTGALDSRTGDEILDLFRQLNGLGHTVVMITHDPRIAARCGRVVAVKDGRLT